MVQLSRRVYARFVVTNRKRATGNLLQEANAIQWYVLEHAQYLQ
jgi:hypothetical protein